MQTILQEGGGKGGSRDDNGKNVLGETLGVCSVNPMTGFLRNGCCDAGPKDIGTHGTDR